MNEYLNTLYLHLGETKEMQMKPFVINTDICSLYMRENVCHRSQRREQKHVLRRVEMNDIAMASMQLTDNKSSFIFISDFNAHHCEWLNSTHAFSLAAYNFAILSGYEQLVNNPTHVDGGCLDLTLIDLPEVTEASVLAPIGTSGHSAISCKNMLDFEVPYITS